MAVKIVVENISFICNNIIKMEQSEKSKENLIYYNVFSGSHKLIFILVIIIACAVILNRNFSNNLAGADAKIKSVRDIYEKPEIKTALDSLLAADKDKIAAYSVFLRQVLKKNSIAESKYAAMLLTDRGAGIMYENNKLARMIFYEAINFSSDYKRAYYYLFMSSLYDFNIARAISEFLELVYMEYAAPSKILKFMNLALALFIAFILMQIYFFAAVYIKYRRLIKHEALELEIDAASISIISYLSPAERNYMRFLNKNIIIGLFFVIFYCYFMSGFGKNISLINDSCDFLKNPHEFCALNDMTYSREMMNDFALAVRDEFFKKKASAADFYFYLAGVSKLSLNESAQAVKYFKSIPPHSFLSGQIYKLYSDVQFFKDDQLYAAFLSPMRSNTVFMIAVLLNVLLIILFSAAIRTARRYPYSFTASLCGCGTITCPNCRTNVGLCNNCLAKLSDETDFNNIISFFYPIDCSRIFMISFLLPGVLFFYVNDHLKGIFYGIFLTALFLLNLLSFFTLSLNYYFITVFIFSYVCYAADLTLYQYKYRPKLYNMDLS
ncbi:MAG: hypothetical protein QMC67_12265 [Candidatus Wallbacteria bacterium]